MGLDISIYKETLLSDNMRTRERGEKYKRTVETTEMLYLRKANQIHRYFVDCFADGVDECQRINISIDDIKKLNALCKQVIKKSKLIPAILDGGWGSWSADKDKVVKTYKLNGLEFEAGESKPVKELKTGDIFKDEEWGDNFCRVDSVEDTGERAIVRHTALHKGLKVENPMFAQDNLPTQAGFFFGATEYDEWYIEDLKDYVRQADEIIADYEETTGAGVNPYDIDYYYQASW